MLRKGYVRVLLVSVPIFIAAPAACIAAGSLSGGGQVPPVFGDSTIDENKLRAWNEQNNPDIVEQTTELIKDLSGFSLGWELRGAVNDGDWKQASLTTAMLAGSFIGPEKLLPLLKAGKTLTAETLGKTTSVYQMVRAEGVSGLTWDPYSRTFISTKGIIDNSKWSLDVNEVMKKAANDRGTIILEMAVPVKNLGYNAGKNTVTLSDDFAQRLSPSKNGLVYDPASDSLVPNDGSVGRNYYRLKSVIFQKADERNLYLKTINPHKGVNNCISSAEAFNSWLNGAPATAMPKDLRWETYAYGMEKKYGSKFSDAMRPDDIEAALSFNGATAIAFEQQWNGIWHAFNVYRDKDGVVHYVDAFFGREFTKDQLHGALVYLKTNDKVLTTQSLDKTGLTPESVIGNIKKALDEMNGAQKTGANNKQRAVIRIGNSAKPPVAVIKYDGNTVAFAEAFSSAVTPNAGGKGVIVGNTVKPATAVIKYNGNTLNTANALAKSAGNASVAPTVNGGVKVSYAGNPQKAAGTIAGNAVTPAANGGVIVGNIVKPATAAIKYNANTQNTAVALAKSTGNAIATPTANGGVRISYGGNPQKTAMTIAGNAVTPNGTGGVNIGKVVNMTKTANEVNTSTTAPVNPNPGPVPKGTTAQQVEATGGSWGGWVPAF